MNNFFVFISMQVEVRLVEQVLLSLSKSSQPIVSAEADKSIF